MQRNINEEKQQQTNKRFIDLNHSKDNSMGVKFQTKEQNVSELRFAKSLIFIIS